MHAEPPTTHIVLTRFALRLAKDGPPPSSEWLQRRFSLFERYCLPSMLSQSRSDFTWLLFADPDLPAEHRARLHSYAERYPFVRISHAAHVFAVSDFARGAAEACSPGSYRVITTRIDNDDAVSVDHIQRIREAAAGVPDDSARVLVFTSGFELSRGRLYWRPFPRSPFASLVEPAGAVLKTVMAEGHESVDALGPVIEMGSPAAWMQVVHSDNVLNRVRGVRVPRSRLRGAFVVDDQSLFERESALSLMVGIPASAGRLALELARHPRYRRKVLALFRRDRTPR